MATLVPAVSRAQTWIGSGTDYRWTNSSNWSSTLSNPSGSTITFSGSPTLTSSFVNNNWTVNAVSFSGSTAFTLGGNATLTINTASGITQGDSSQQKITVPLTLGASQTWSTTSTGSLLVGGSGPVNLGANTLTLTAGASGAIAIQNAITGTGSLTLNGAGVTSLRGENTFSGGVTVGATSTLNINSGTALGTGTLTLANGATINTNSVMGSPATSVGAIRDVNNNAQTWNGNFTFTGTNNLNLGTGAVTLANAGAAHQVTVTANTLTVAGNIAGSSNLTKLGSGALTLSGTNTFGNATTGGVILSAGTLNINSATALGAATANFTIAGGTIDNTSGGNIVIANNNAQNWNGNFTYTGTNDLNLGTGAVTMNASRTIIDPAGNLTVGGAIGGSGFSLTKLGAGALTLSGANTFSGGFTAGNATTVGGTVNINNAAALGTGTFTVGNTTTLDNTSGGAITATNAMSWGGNVTYAGVNNGNLSLTGSLALTATRQVTVSQGTLTLGSATGNISGAGFGLTKLGNGTLTLAGLNSAWNGGVTLSSGTLNINSVSALGSGTFSIGANTTIDNTSGGAITLTTAPAQTWNGNFTFTGSNSLNLGAGAVTLAATPTITTAANTLTVGGNISGSFGLTKAGAGSLVLGGNNSYTGTTTLSAGTLVLGNVTALGQSGSAGALTITGGTLDSNVSNLVLSSNNAQNWNGNFTFAGTQNLNLGTGAVTMNANRTVTVAANTLTVGGAIGGGAVGLTKEGAGTLALAPSGTNQSTYTGATTLNNGTLSLAFNGLTTPTNLISSSSALVLGGGNLTATAKNNVASSQTFNGTSISSGSSSVTATANGGSGSMTLTLGALTRSAGATVNFTLPATGSIGTTTANTNGILGPWATVGSGTTLQYAANNGSNQVASYSGATAATANLGNVTSSTTNYSYNSAATPTGARTANTLRYTGGASTTALGTNSLTLNGLMNAGSGTLTITGTAGNAGLVIGSTGELTIINNTQTTAISSVISGTGLVSFSSVGGTGSLTLSGVNTYNGGLTLNSGTLNINNASALGTGTFTFNGGSINNTSGGALSFTNAMSIADDLTFAGSAAANNLTQGTGTVTLAGGNRTVTVTNAGGTFALNGVIGDGGNAYSLTKAGAGTLSLGAANTYTGGTTISAGTLTVASTGSLASTGALVLNGGTLNLNNTAQTVASLNGVSGTNITLATGSALTVNDTGADTFAGVLAGASTTSNLTKSGTGTLTLTGANTYQGATTITGGTLAVSTLANGGSASGLGQSTNANSNLVLNGGTLQYTGAAVTSDRLFSLGTSGGTLDASGSGTLNLTNSGAMGFNAQSGTRTLTLTGSGVGSLAAVIGDNGSATSLTKTGTGTWTLGNVSGTSAANTYSGATTLSGGTLTVLSGSSLGNGTGNLTVNNATLNLNNTAQSVGVLSGAGSTINLASGHTLTVGGAVDSTYSGTFAGPGAINFNGTANLTLSGSSTNSGAIAINNGTLIVQNNNALGTGFAGTTVNNGATLDIDGGRSVVNGTLTLAAGSTLLGTNGDNRWNGNTTLTGNATITNNSSAANYLAIGPAQVAQFDRSTDPAGPPQNMSTLALGSNTLTLSSSTNANTIYVNSGITGTGNIIIDTKGTVAYAAGVNTYTGTTTVNNGNLTFVGGTYNVVPNSPTAPGFFYINGPLVIGDGDLTTSARVTLQSGVGFGDGQMNFTTPVTINRDGTLANSVAQTIDTLTFNGGGTVDLGTTGSLFLNNTLTVSSGNATITGSGSTPYLDLNIHQVSPSLVANVQRSFVVNGNLTIDTRINDGGIDLSGTGTLYLRGNSSSGYELKTNVASGSTLVVQHNNALGLAGDNSGSSTDNGTVVASGGRLQLSKLTTDLTIASEGLHLTGSGISNSGALENIGGNNTWGGSIFLGNTTTPTAATIKSSVASDTLYLTGTTSAASGTPLLTVSGVGTTDFTSTSAINTVGGGITKIDNGTLILEGNNGYQGATTISEGRVLVKHSNGLGDVAGGTTVAAGAELQLSKTGGGANISIGAEALTLNGFGYDAAHGTAGTTGALNNLSGNNSFGGTISLASASSIQSANAGDTLTLSGGIVNSTSHTALTIRGPGGVTETGAITTGNVTMTGSNISSTGSGGTLTVNGATTTNLTISGSHTSALDGITLTLGNMTVGDGSTTTLVQSGALSSSTATNTLTINSNSTVQAYYGSGSTTFTGMMAGGGTFQKDGAGTLVFNTSFNAQAAGLTLVFSGGEIDLGAGVQIKVGTIHFTGNTILDFNSSTATLLQSSTLIIDAGVSVTVNNWASETDFWMVQTAGGATGTFYQPGSPNLNAGANVTGVNPESQITFASWSNLNTTWIQSSYQGYTSNEIRPIPEPATYGALFLSSCVALLGWRRYSRRHSGRRE